MDQLKARLLELVNELKKEQHDSIMLRLENLISVYPFNEYEFLISSLMGYDKISLDDYHELRDDYLARNLYLYIFGSAQEFEWLAESAVFSDGVMKLA